MSVLRTIRCDVCGETFTEEDHGEGFKGWGALQGIALNGVVNPNLCPKHLADVAEMVDRLAEQVRQEQNNGVD